ncbi:MAG TPA: VOC family protein [Candidatus Dormibacteraeota bacterium]|nr:VOC family protein [Candidatus Dormibacteraeota bacterium]
MAKNVKPVPDGFHTVTPYLIQRDAAQALEFYKKAFGAETRLSMPGPGGKIMHAEVKIGDSIIFLADENLAMAPDNKSPQTAGCVTGSTFLYVPNVDAVVKKAVDAGAKVTMPVTDMFWGDRFGKVVDPFGHHWGVATHIEEVPPQEMDTRRKEWEKQMAQQMGQKK